MKALFVASCCNKFTRHTCRLSERYNNEHFAAIAENWDVVENAIGIIVFRTPLLTRIHLKPSKDRKSQGQQNMGWNFLSIPKLQRLHRTK